MANFLALIERWRAAATEFVHFVGWQQGNPKHARAWFDSRPVQNDPRRPDTWAYHDPRSFESETGALLQHLKTHHRELNRLPLSELLSAAKRLNDPDRRKQMPPVTQLAKLLADADVVVSIAASGLIGKLLPTSAPEEPKGDFKPATWFTRNTKVPPSRLRKAAKRDTMRVRTQTISGTVMYSVEDARRWWSDDMR